MSEEKLGRPTKYKEEYNELAHKLALLGATDEEIADALNIAPSTLYEWKIKYRILSESINKGKLVADAEIAASLFKRAKGYDYTEIKVESSAPLNNDNVEDVELDGVVSKIVTIKKHVPADVAATFIWLKNRRPKDWKDKREVVNEITGDLPFDKIKWADDVEE